MQHDSWGWSRGKFCSSLSLPDSFPLRIGVWNISESEKRNYLVLHSPCFVASLRDADSIEFNGSTMWLVVRSCAGGRGRYSVLVVVHIIIGAVIVRFVVKLKLDLAPFMWIMILWHLVKSAMSSVTHSYGIWVPCCVLVVGRNVLMIEIWLVCSHDFFYRLVLDAIPCVRLVTTCKFQTWSARYSAEAQWCDGQENIAQCVANSSKVWELTVT